MRATAWSGCGGRPSSASALLSASAMSPTESMSVPSRSKTIRSYMGARKAACYIRTMSPKEKAEKVYATMSGIPLKAYYRPDDVKPYDESIGNPGQFPFTRGVHETMYRGKLW